MSSVNSKVEERRLPSVASADHISLMDFMQDESSEPGKRTRQPSRKALQNAIGDLIKELSKQALTLKIAADSVYDAIKQNNIVDENTLNESVKRYEDTFNKLEELYAQDKWGDNLADADPIRQSVHLNLEYARTASLNAKVKQQAQQEDSISRTARRSSRSSRKSPRYSTTSSTRTKDEAAAAKAQAEYDKLLAEKEHEKRQHKLEEQRLLEERRAQYDKEISLLTADRMAAIAEPMWKLFRGH